MPLSAALVVTARRSGINVDARYCKDPESLVRAIAFRQEYRAEQVEKEALDKLYEQGLTPGCKVLLQRGTRAVVVNFQEVTFLDRLIFEGVKGVHKPTKVKQIVDLD